MVERLVELIEILLHHDEVEWRFEDELAEGALELVNFREDHF